MQFLKQSTAATIIVGRAVDLTNELTPEVGLAAGTVDEIGVYKHGATSLTDISGTTTFTHRAEGMYTTTLSTSDTNTLGHLVFCLHDLSVCRPIRQDYMVIPAGTYDNLIGADNVCTGFGSGNQSLHNHLTAIMDEDSTAPSDVGQYDPTTDSLEATGGFMTGIQGSGFATGTDSLKQIRDAMDTLVAPAVVTSTAMSGVGFLSDAVTLVRQLTDEPSTTPKYTNSDVVARLQVAFAAVLADLNVSTDHPILVRHDITLVSGTLDYLLPTQVGEIWRVARILDNGYVPLYEAWPDSHFSGHQSGWVIEGNVFRLLNDWQSSDTLEILFVPQGEPLLHYGTGVPSGSIRNATYKWTASGSGTNEYYCEIAAGGDPSISEPTSVLVNGASATEGTLGSLSNNEWAYGDNDTLGYSTVYVRDDTQDPDLENLHYVQTGTGNQITLAATPTDGTLDTRANSYPGYMLRVLTSGNGYVQERKITAHDNTTRIVTVSPAFDPPGVMGTAVAAGMTYEVLPSYSTVLKDVVCHQAALDILAAERNSKGMQALGQRLVVKMRALRMLIGKKSSRFPGHMTGDTSDNSNREGFYGWIL